MKLLDIFVKFVPKKVGTFYVPAADIFQRIDGRYFKLEIMI